MWILNIYIFTSTSENGALNVSKNWFWKFEKIGKHFNIFVFCNKNFMSKQKIPPFSKQPPLCSNPPFLHKIVHSHPSYQIWEAQSHLLQLCAVFDSILSNIDEVLLINPSANVFVFEDFNVHHKDWLTYSGGTDRPGELCYNFSISNDLTQMVNFPTRIPDCDSHSPALLDLFLSSDAIICSTMAFPPLGNSDHVVVWASIYFPSNC